MAEVKKNFTIEETPSATLYLFKRIFVVHPVLIIVTTFVADLKKIF